MGKRKKHFAKLRAEEIRRKTLTKAQKRNQMCTYLKNMANYKHSQLKNKSFEEIWVDSFVPMDSEINENVEAKVDDEAEMKKYMEVVPEEKIAVDAIPLATKPPIIVDWKIIKEGKIGYFQIIRADGSSRKYSSMIRMLQNINREDLETLWKLVKAKHGNTRPEKAYERVLWGDLKVLFEPDVESEVWRNLQGYNVTVWKLFSSSGGRIVGIKRHLSVVEVTAAGYISTAGKVQRKYSKSLLLLVVKLLLLVLVTTARRVSAVRV
ncbi:hypothetical protein Tco_1569191 [Tanacetum coccineum]